MTLRVFLFFCALIIFGSALSDFREPLADDELPKKHRIVTLSPHLAEIVYASGAGEYMVGVMAGTNYPVDAIKHPVVGGFNGVDFEAIITLEPTIVLAWEEGNKAADISKLERLGIPVYILSATDLFDLEHQIIDVSRLFGTEKTANELIFSIKNKILNIDRHRRSNRHTKVFIKIWDKPIFTIGRDHYINEALKLCGVTNVGEKYPFTAGSVSIETMLLSGADTILDLTGVDLVNDSKAISLFHFYRSLSMKTIEADSQLLMRLSPRFVDGLDELCARIAEPFEGV